MKENDGLICGYILDGKGGGTSIEWQGIDSWEPGQGLLWVHLDYAAGRVKKWLETKSRLTATSRQMLVEEDTRPRFMSSPDGFFLILRGVNCNPGSSPEDMVALRMCIDEHRIITMRHRKVMAIDDIRVAIESGSGPTDASEFLVTVNARIADRIGDVVSEIDDQMDEIEDRILEAENRPLRSRLADMRRQCISLRRYIAPQRDVLARFQHERLSWLTEGDRVRLREIAERAARFVDDIDAARDRAAITQEELNSRLSEQMNKAMYLLSIIAAIFLPLGLVTGLLGVNVGGIPGTKSEYAFAVVTVLLLFIAFLLIRFFKHVKWL